MEKNFFTAFNDSIKLSAYVSVEKNILKYDEPVYSTFHLENHSDEGTVRFLEGGDTRNSLGRSLCYIFHLRKSDGMELADPHPEVFKRTRGGRCYTHSLKGIREGSNSDKKEFLFEKKLFLKHFVKLHVPGKYLLSISRKMKFENHIGVNEEVEIVTNELPLEILEYDEIERLKDIQVLISKFKTPKRGRDEPEQILKILYEYCPHPVLLDFFINLAKEVKNTVQSFMWKTLNSLSKFREEEAIRDGMMRMLNIRFEDQRLRCTTDELARDSIKRQFHNVSSSIARSVSPFAEDYLVKFKKNKTIAVRNCLANRLCKSKRFICYLVFEEYIHDESDWIRKVSRRYLDEHPITHFRKDLFKRNSYCDVVIKCFFK